MADIADNAANLVRHEQRALTTGAWLLGILAVASVAVLVGGRMADQTRRVGLLKAVGGTPGLGRGGAARRVRGPGPGRCGAGLAVGWLAARCSAIPGRASSAVPVRRR